MVVNRVRQQAGSQAGGVGNRVREQAGSQTGGVQQQTGNKITGQSFDNQEHELAPAGRRSPA